jgi:hypothetical protein
MTTLFMAIALFFPRLSLLFAWMFDNIPANDTPFIVDFIMALFVPRFWLAYVAHYNQEHIIWVILFVIFGLTELFSGVSRTSSSSSK